MARNPRKPVTSAFVVAPSSFAPREPEEKRRQRYIRRQSIRFTLFVLLVLSVQRFLSTPGLLAKVACTSSQDSLTVPLRAQGQPLSLQLSTNFDDPFTITPSVMPNAVTTLSYLQQWQPPLVRLHFGFRGVTSMPESRPGQWDFSRPDGAISQLRARNVSFVLNVRSAPPWMFDSTGHLPPSRFPLFAQYMARVVGWYNKGGFTDENGVYHASGHIGWVHTWEIWNEPDSGSEIPVSTLQDRHAPFFSPQDYALLYDEVTKAMRAVDPTIVTGGPAVIGYQVSTYTNYIGGFLSHVTQPVGFLSIHFYSTGDRRQPDEAVLQNLTDGYSETIDAVQRLMHQMKRNIPLWVDELGFNESSVLPVDPRGSSPIGYAFAADAFIQGEVRNVAQINQFPFAGNQQNGLVDFKTSQPFRTYWLYVMLAHAFPPGSQMLAMTHLPSGVVALSAIGADRQKLHILLVNMRAASAKDINGHGVPHTVCIDLVNKHAGVGLPFGAPATEWTFDATTPINDLPTSSTQWLINAGQDHLIFQEQLSGYSATLVELPLN